MGDGRPDPLIADVGFAELLHRIRQCTLCAEVLPLGPRPVLQASPSARLLIVGQAPGRRVHDTGLPFNDRSGDRLREWLGIDRATFYDARLVALVPMGFCYPGTTAAGDAPPRPECAPAWREQLLPRLQQVRLTVAAGRFAHAYHLRSRASVAQTVRRWRETGDVIPVPHPSPRNQGWLQRNPWFAEELLPELRVRVRQALGQ